MKLPVRVLFSTNKGIVTVNLKAPSYQGKRSIILGAKIKLVEEDKEIYEINFLSMETPNFTIKLTSKKGNVKYIKEFIEATDKVTFTKKRSSSLEISNDQAMNLSFALAYSKSKIQAFEVLGSEQEIEPPKRINNSFLGMSTTMH